MTTVASTFNGFEPANTTPVPDVLFDELLPYLNEAQLKVLLYIVRRTLGFKKTTDAISLKQFRFGITKKDGEQLDKGCGLKNFTTITKALNSLEEMQCIEREKRETAEGDAATTVYRIHFKGTTANVVPTTDSVVGVLQKTHDRTTQSGVGVLRKKEPQETVIQQTEKQETVIQESDAPTNTQPETFVGLSTDAPSQDVSSSEQGKINASHHTSLFHGADSSVDGASHLPSHLQDAVRLDETPVRIAGETTPDEASKQDEQGKVEQPPLVVLPLAEPDMTGKWVHEKCVLYAEWKNEKRYSVKMREAQLAAAAWLHQRDSDLTLDQFKAAYDERDDSWWMEHKRAHPHVTDMKAKEQSSGVIRVYAMLERLASKLQHRVPTPISAGRKMSQAQQELRDKAPDFHFLTNTELMELPLPERKKYNAAMREAMRANEEKHAVNA